MLEENMFPKLEDCAELDNYYGSCFDESKYVFDPQINSNGACFGKPYIRERENGDDDFTYVCPTIEEMKWVVAKALQGRISNEEFFALMKMEDAHELARKLIEIRK